MAARVIQERCDGCGMCEKACPFNVIRMVQGKPAVDEQACIACNTCVAACPFLAIVPDDREGAKRPRGDPDRGSETGIDLMI